MSLQIACLCGCKVTLVAFIWLFSKVCFQMSPQITCPRRCKVTLVAFVWLFSTIFLNVSSMYFDQRRHTISLVALVYLFPTVHFHLRPQVSCLILCILATVAFVCAFPNAPSNFLDQTCKITFFAFVKIFPTLCIQMYTWMLCMQDCILTLFAFFYFSSLCIFGDPNNIRILSFLVKPNNIRIRSFLGSRIIFVFVFGHFRETE